jgi:outer membrane scaffolding protein for murein synthesis (MipA/OmpV family)
VVVTLAGGIVPAVAFDDDDDEHGGGEGDRNWELMIGGGGFYGSQYTGSDEMAFEAVPLVLASYETRYLKFFIEGDEAGIGIKFADSIPVSLSLGAGLGEGRDNGDVNLLKGTPTLENSYSLFGGAKLALPFVDLSSTVNYFPITANYDEADRSDEDYDGMLVDVGIGKEWFHIPFMVQLGGGVSWMNSDYAEANYSVNYATERLSTFKAESGLHSVNLSSTIVMFFSERMGTALIGEGKYLLNDAADSPLTKNEFDASAGLFLFYRF